LLNAPLSDALLFDALLFDALLSGLRWWSALVVRIS
jgi:hypothetical protein